MYISVEQAYLVTVYKVTEPLCAFVDGYSYKHELKMLELEQDDVDNEQRTTTTHQKDRLQEGSV